MTAESLGSNSRGSGGTTGVPAPMVPKPRGRVAATAA